MIMRWLEKLTRHLAFKHNKALGLYKRVCDPGGYEWAEYMRLHGKLRAMGEGCFVVRNTVITDPEYVSLGNNVLLTGCTLFCHDGTVSVMSRATGKNLDNFGPITIGDNVFVGHGSVILPGVTIGSNVIIGAGSVVARSIPANSVAVGAPATVVTTFDALVARREKQAQEYPWASLLPQWAQTPTPELTAQIRDLRLAYFFGANPKPTAPAAAMATSAPPSAPAAAELAMVSARS